MSFSQDVKNELAGHVDKSRHCQIAELSAMMAFGCKIRQAAGEIQIEFESDNLEIQKKYFTLIDKTNTMNLGGLSNLKDSGSGFDTVDGLVIQQTCCKRAYLRGAFLLAGSISDPNKGYHFEIVCRSMPQADPVQYVMKALKLDAKIVERQKHFVVYLKEGEQIVEALGLMGASLALMELENVRILKEMRNSVNRRVNCEAANITKTVNASVRQVEDIQLIEAARGLDSLPENLQEIARVRLENPDAPLKDLGEMLTPPIGKSGVNHRLRKISEIADKLR